MYGIFLPELGLHTCIHNGLGGVLVALASFVGRQQFPLKHQIPVEATTKFRRRGHVMEVLHIDHIDHGAHHSGAVLRGHTKAS